MTPMADRPTSREEHTTSGSGSADRRGDGLNLGGSLGTAAAMRDGPV